MRLLTRLPPCQVQSRHEVGEGTVVEPDRAAQTGMARPFEVRKIRDGNPFVLRDD